MELTMKSLAVMIFFVFALCSYADVTLVEESSGSKMEIYYSKNIMAHHIDGQVTNITDVNKGLIYIFNPARKTYFQATFKEMKDVADKLNEQTKELAKNPQYQQFVGQTSGGKVVVKKTGTSTIAGYKCDEYTITATESLAGATVCLSKELMTLLNKELDTVKIEKLMNSLDLEEGGDVLSLKIAELEEKYGYAMSESFSSGTTGMGAGLDTIVTSVSTTKIDKSVFSIPTGYERLSMKAAMGEY